GARDMTTSDPDREALLVRLGDEFAARYRRGERPTVQEYAARHPELAQDIRDLFPALVELEQVKEDSSYVEAAPAPALRPAFDEPERNRLIKRVMTTDPEPLDRVNRHIPRDLVMIVHQAHGQHDSPVGPRHAQGSGRA